MKKLIAAVALAAAPVLCFAEGVLGHPNFYSGNTYLALDANSQVMYLIGVMDGLAQAPLMASRDLARAATFDNCTKTMQITGSQLHAIVNKYLFDHPERWGTQMSILVFSAMIQACEGNGTPF